MSGVTDGRGGVTGGGGTTPGGGGSASKAVEFALQEYNQHGDGKTSEAFLSNKYGAGGDAWCSAFANWTYKKAGIRWGSTGNPNWSPDNWNKWTGRKYTPEDIRAGRAQPQPGDLILYLDRPPGSPDRQAHTGLIERYDSRTGIIYTIEGNRSNKLQRFQVRYDSRGFGYGFQFVGP